MKKPAWPKSKAKNAYDLLTDVRKLILEEPLRYAQDWWIYQRGSKTLNDCGEPPAKGYPACGTVGCVAGWVATLTTKSLPADPYAIEDIAAEVLGLPYQQGHELFHGMAVAGSVQTVKHARAGAAHIARFQKLYAAQLKAKKV